MKQSKSNIVLLLSAAMLLSCGTVTSSVTPASSEESSETSIVSTEESSEPLSSSELESTVSSSEEPISNVFNIYNAAAKLVKVLSKYATIDLKSLLTSVKECGEDFDVASSSDTKLNEASAAVLLATALKQTLPDRIGARSFSGFYFDPTKVEIRSVSDTSKNGPVYKALEYLSTTGIFHVPATTSLSGKKVLAEKNFNKYIDRIHAYFGSSLADDFFSTVNHDYLYDENPNHDVPADGRSSWDEEYDEDNLKNIYDSRLIPEEGIVDFALDLADEVPAIQSFVDTYLDFDSRKSGEAAGMVAGIKKYLAAATPADFIEVCREMAKEQGFCILWSKAETGKYTYGGRNLLTVECYNYSGTSADATSARQESIDRFKPVFQEVIGNDDDEALKLATDYSDFKIQMATHKESDKKSDGVYLLTGDAEKEEKTPTLYFTSTFSTGETLMDFFASLGFIEGSVIFSSAQDIRAIVDLIKPETLDLVKGMAVWQMLQHYTICLPDTPAVNAWAWKTGYGTNKETLWDSKAAFYSYGLPYISGLVSNYWTGTEEFKADSDAVINLVNGLKETLLGRIEGADWISQDAKDKASLKVAAMKYSIGGKNADESTLAFPNIEYANKAAGGSLYGNIGLMETADLNAATAVAGYSTDGSFYDYVGSIDPLTANAFYMPAYNGIDITLGFMACYNHAAEQTPLELLSNYGWVVAHEISHGFDSNGIQYNENGVKPDEGWFLADDVDAYSARCKKVADFYNGYEVMPERPTDGNTVITEAIADVNGLHVCLDYADDFDGFDFQQFFINCAKMFASYASQYTYSSALAADEHPFGRARVNRAMSSMDEFYEAFGVQEGDAMYVAPEDRIIIW